jgi:hypothetical protein
MSVSEEFTAFKKAKVLEVLTKIVHEYKEKYHVYHVLKDTCNCRVPGGKIFPEREDTLQFVNKKMVDHEVHGYVHECIIKLVDNLQAVDAFPARSQLFQVLNDPEVYEDAHWGHQYLYEAEL